VAEANDEDALGYYFVEHAPQTEFWLLGICHQIMSTFLLLRILLNCGANLRYMIRSAKTFIEFECRPKLMELSSQLVSICIPRLQMPPNVHHRHPLKTIRAHTILSPRAKGIELLLFFTTILFAALPASAIVLRDVVAQNSLSSTEGDGGNTTLTYGKSLTPRGSEDNNGDNDQDNDFSNSGSLVALLMTLFSLVAVITVLFFTLVCWFKVNWDNPLCCPWSCSVSNTPRRRRYPRGVDRVTAVQMGANIEERELHPLTATDNDAANDASEAC